ncbi:hypothetical protein D915_010296, partial [Fasciola hepatica]
IPVRKCFFLNTNTTTQLYILSVCHYFPNNLLNKQKPLLQEAPRDSPITWLSLNSHLGVLD